MTDINRQVWVVPETPAQKSELRGWRQLAIALLQRLGGNVVMRADDALDIEPDDYLVEVQHDERYRTVSVRLVGDSDE